MDNMEIGSGSSSWLKGTVFDCPEYYKLDQELRNLVPEPEESDDDDDTGPWFTGYFSDTGDSYVGEYLKPSQWYIYYDIVLCARIGLYCYNYEKGTNYEFESVTKKFTPSRSYRKTFATYDVADPSADGSSPLAFETCINHNYLAKNNGKLLWETCYSRVQGDKEAELEWDNEAINDEYKGEMPEWLFKDDKKRYYKLKEDDMLNKDNEFLKLFAELAFFSRWCAKIGPSDITVGLPLMLKEVVVETRGDDAEVQLADKLKAANAIFYMRFDCEEDPVSCEMAHYRAVVRKTMDGKPGHMRLEVMSWNIHTSLDN
ncbi:unnamed protein product [Cochlearia groenlandica]